MNIAEINKTAAQIQDVLVRGKKILESLPDSSAADTQDHLIEPILEALGYPKAKTRRHVAHAGNFPDRLVWPVPITEIDQGDRAARFVIEEKPLGADFDKPGTSRADTPARQIQRYLEQHRLADDATLGILTDGRVWRIYERQTAADWTHRVMVRPSGEYVLGGPSGPGSPSNLLGDRDDAYALVDRLSMATFVPGGRPEPLFPRARRFLANTLSAARDEKPLSVLETLCGSNLQRQNANLVTTGLIGDAQKHDWESGFVFARGPAYQPSEKHQESLLGPPRIELAAIPFRPGLGTNGQQLRKGDIGLCARAFGNRDQPLLLCAYTLLHTGGNDSPPQIRMRLALRVRDKTTMTAEFNPDMPPATVLVTIEKVMDLLRGPERRRTTEKFREAFDILPLQQQFYEHIEFWLKLRLQGVCGGSHDATMLRHLIQTLFS